MSDSTLFLFLFIFLLLEFFVSIFFLLHLSLNFLGTLELYSSEGIVFKLSFELFYFKRNGEY